MKKIIALILALITCATVLSSCLVVTTDGINTQPLGTQTTDPSKTVSSQTSANPIQPGTTQSPSDVAKPTIQEQVLYDINGVKITATGEIEDTLSGIGIKLFIENNTDKDIGIGIDHLIVNHYMVLNLFHANVPAGKKTNCTLDLMNLEDYGITKIGLVEVYMRTFDSATFMTISELGHAEIKTNLYDSMDGGSGTGTELLNQDGIKVVAQYLDNDSFWGKEIVLYIENTSGHDVTLFVADLSVNDFAITSLGVYTLLSDKKTFGKLELFETELKENGIETIEKVEFKLRAYNPNNLSDYFTSDVLTCIPG